MKNKKRKWILYLILLIAAIFLVASEESSLNVLGSLILQLLITTGLRRGECIGLQWQDVDFDTRIIRVERAVTYTPESGIVVAPPKTATSIRTIPLVESTTNLLKALYRQRQKQYPNCFMATALLFCKDGAPFEPRDPSAVTRRMKRFVTRAGLPDVSPHDLRHTCASLLLSSGADIKIVQEILGHADASVSISFFRQAFIVR